MSDDLMDPLISEINNILEIARNNLRKKTIRSM